MCETIIGAVLIGIAVGLAGFLIGFVWLFIRLFFISYFGKRPTMNTYTFKLYRRLRNHKHPATMIISAFNLRVECFDPFVERIRLAHKYPGWAIATDFSSATDETFDEIFGDDDAAA